MIQVSVVISRSLADDGQWDLESALAGTCAATPGLSVLLIPHIYHLTEESPVWKTLAGLTGPVIFISWLYPRPAEWMLRAHGIGTGAWTILNWAGPASAEAAHAAILAQYAKLPGMPVDDSDAGPLSELAEPVAPRWYPVKDGARCTHCQHCLQFCLFGVYELTADGRVVVAHPDLCKAGCPACSRICPEGAIMFPLYAKDEAIAGAPGRQMVPDAVARRMFYLRTRRPCPVCGSTAEAPGKGTGGVCEECGRPGGSAAPASPPPDDTPAIIRDDLDALLDDLDALSGGSG